LLIEHAGHHLDLYGPNPADPPSIIAAREMEIALFHKWLHI
jgi:hypothetical protein